MASLQTSADIPVHIRSEESSSERRISPSWTIDHFKTRLEPITGIPSASQRLLLSLGSSQPSKVIDDVGDGSTQLSAFPLQPYAEIYVQDSRPSHLRTTYTGAAALSSVEKYSMPADQYEILDTSVLAYKRANQLGRFDPNLPSSQDQQKALIAREAEERHIQVGARCRLLPPRQTPTSGIVTSHAATKDGSEDDRRGTIRHVGSIPDLPGVGAWIGIALDEPVGKNDGSLKGQTYFECEKNHGVFVRPERVEVGDFKNLLDADLEDMEEI